MACRRPDIHETARRAAAFLALPAILGAFALHTELKESHPAQDAVLAESPAAVTLTYTTEVQLALSTVAVRSASTDQTQAGAGNLSYLSEDRRDVLVLPLSERLPSGSYVVAWTTAGPDGHALSGEFGFRVDVPTAEAEPGATADGDTAVAGGPVAGAESGGVTDEAQGVDAGLSLDFAAMATRFVFYLGIVGVLGAIAFKVLVLGQAAQAGIPAAVIEGASARTWRIAAVAVSLLLVSVPLRLWFQAKAFFPDDIAGNLTTVTAGTAWSTGWWLQGVSGVLAAAGIALSRPRTGAAAGWRVMALGAVLMPIVPLVSGHAWADDPRAVSIAATYVHVVAASAWVGGLCCLLLAGLPALRQAPSGLPVLVGALSRLAMVAVGLLVLSGTVKAWLHLGAISDLWTTPWGRALLIKDLWVGGVMALGLYNWRVVRPALAINPSPGRLSRSGRFELALGAMVILVTSYLVVQPLN